MKSIILNKPFEFQQDNIDFDPQLQPQEVLLKVHNIGICGTDYHAFRGRQPFFSYPRRLGHELGAEIVAIGSAVDAERYPLSSRVSVEPYLHCGTCQTCRRGRFNCCEKLQVLGVHTDGGMADFLKVPAEKVYISTKLEFEQLALVETLAIGCHAVNRADIQSDDTVLVIGSGPIGLSVIEFARLKSQNVYVLDVNENRLKFCSDNYEVKTILKTAENFDLMSFLNEKPTVIFDATGNPESMNNTVLIAANGAKIVFVGLHQQNIEIKDSEFHRREITLLASRNALPEDFKFIIEKIEQGVIDTSKWITHRSNFEDLIENFQQWLDPQSGVIKAVVKV